MVRSLFSAEAYCSLSVGALLLGLEMRCLPRAATKSWASGLTRNVMLLLGCFGATLIGYFALQPLMVEARKGWGILSFAQLHTISLGFFALKLGFVLALTWRNSASAFDGSRGPISRRPERAS